LIDTKMNDLDLCTEGTLSIEYIGNSETVRDRGLVRDKHQ